MSWRTGFSGGSLSRARYVLQLAALLGVLAVVGFPVDSAASAVFAVLFAALAVATAVGLWRTTTDDEGPAHLGTAEDVTCDPFADPGLAAKDRWERTVRRLPGRDDEQD